MNKDVKFTTWITEEEDAEKVTNTLISNAKKDGETIGLKKGERNKTIEIAKSLIKQNIDVNIISSATGLSIEEIKKL